MADCESNKIDSNLTGLSFAEEECLKKLPDATPGSGLADGGVFYQLEPNSFSDWGGELSKVARAPIDPSRQNKKGTVTDLDASGGFNIDFTKTNLAKLLQGFFFADARELPSTVPMNAAKIVLTGVTGSSKTFAAAAGLTVFAANQIVYASGFTNNANNGIKTVASVTAGTVVVNEALTDEAAPPAGASLRSVGYQFASGDVNLAVTSGIPSLVSTVLDFTTLANFIPGAWLFLGGDTEANKYANNVGYARIKSVTAHAVVFDDTTWTPATESGAAKSIRVFIGTIIKNEKTASLIKRRSYTFERTLGEGPTAAQAEYLVGAVANEFTLNIPQADKLNADMSFVACDNIYRSGEAGDTLLPGTRVAALGEDAFNTSLDVYRIKMAVIDPTASNPAALFGYVSEANASIKNNVSPNKAVGVLGAFDTSAGNFDIGGSITAYFTTVAAVKAIRANADVGLSIITAASNAGFLFDIPLLGLGGGRLNVEKDNPITVPLEPAGAENPNGYTMLHETFYYLPNLALPV